MNRAQKAARFILIVLSVAIALSLIAAGLLYLKFGNVKVASAGFGFMGLIGFTGFVPVIFKKESGKVQCDERDTMINRKAAIAGFGSAYLFVGLACMLPFFIMGPNATIRVTWLPCIFCGAGILTYYMHSIMILVLYGKEVQDTL